jgi:hypothetical protein
MPANLNALIRYKTINSCLYGGRRRWSIRELIEKCSDALAEYRGRYEPVSERTIRDDIRVMRSEILGYNAPIAQQKGLYYYSDPDYSIMTISFTDSGLIERIIKFLGEIKPEVSHPELEIILEKLTNLKKEDYREEKQRDSILFSLDAEELFEHKKVKESFKKVRKPVKVKESRSIISRNEEAFEPMAQSVYAPLYPNLMTWSDIFLIIN